MELAEEALDPRIEDVPEVPGYGGGRPVGRVEVLALGRKLEVDVGQLAADAAGQGPVGEGRAVGREARAAVEVLGLFSAAIVYYSFILSLAWERRGYDASVIRGLLVWRIFSFKILHFERVTRRGGSTSLTGI